MTACIFVTAISEFDQKLYEDASTNRMDEAVTLYDQICNHPSFGRTSMILFLNKRDLFAAKLAKVGSMDKWTQHSKHFSPEKKAELARLGNDYDKCIQVRLALGLGLGLGLTSAWFGLGVGLGVGLGLGLGLTCGQVAYSLR